MSCQDVPGRERGHLATRLGQSRALGAGRAIVLLISAPAARPTPPTSSPPATRTNPQVDSGWQAGTCTEEPPESTAALLGRHAGPVLRTRGRASAMGLHPVHRQTQRNLRNRCRRKTGRRTARPSASTCRSGSASTRARPTAARWRPSKPAPAAARPVARSAESAVTAAAPPLGVPMPPVPGVTKVAVYNVDPAEGRAGPLRARTGRQRSLPRSRRRLGRRLPRGVHDRRPESAADPRHRRADPEKPAHLQRPRRRRHLHHHARAPASAKPSPNRAASTRPTCSPPPTRKAKHPGTSSRRAPRRRSSRRSRPAPRRKNCDTIPYDAGASTSTPAPPRPTRRPAPRSRSRSRTPRPGDRPGQLGDRSGAR